MSGRVRLWLPFAASVLFFAASTILLLIVQDALLLYFVILSGACVADTWIRRMEASTPYSEPQPALTGDRIVLRRRAATTRVWAVAMVLIAIVYAAVMFYGDSDDTERYALYACAFGFYGLVLGYRNWRDPVALSVDARGVAFDDKPRSIIPWDRIGTVGITMIEKQAHLGLMLIEHPAASHEMHWVDRKLAMRQEGSGMPDFILRQAGLNFSLEQIVPAIERLRRQYG
jgi:hypothetical protein